MPHESTSPLGVNVCWHGVVVRVTLAGELDITTAPTLTSSLDEVAAARPEKVVLDLGGLDFVDVAGARALDGAWKSLAAGCPVSVRPPRPPARTVFELTGIAPQLSQRMAPSPPARPHLPIRPQSPPGIREMVPGGEPAVAAVAAAGRREPAAERRALLSRIHTERDRSENLYARAQAAMAWSHALAEAHDRIERATKPPAPAS
jgi:anti-anti-sigma factor